MKYTKPILQVLAIAIACYLLWTLHSIKRDLQELKKFYTDSITVTATTYTTDPRQTDSSPYVTASGFRLDKRNPRKHRVIAISRDLKSRFRFGDKVRVIGAGEHSGIYVVEDVMNKRFRNRIDILLNPKDDPALYKNVKILKV